MKGLALVFCSKHKNVFFRFALYPLFFIPLLFFAFFLFFPPIVQLLLTNAIHYCPVSLGRRHKQDCSWKNNPNLSIFIKVLCSYVWQKRKSTSLNFKAFFFQEFFFFQELLLPRRKSQDSWVFEQCEKYRQ